MTDRRMPRNHAEALQALEKIEPPETRNLVAMAVSQAMMQLAMSNDPSSGVDAPDDQFDLAFLVRVLQEAYQNPEAVKQVLEGKSIAVATGWDV